jgi:predicted DNA-binding protein
LEAEEMPTAKKRINITVDDRIYEAMERLSSERDQSVAGVGLSLIEQALEYQEDLYFSRVADERLGKKQKRIPHEKVWA